MNSGDRGTGGIEEQMGQVNSQIPPGAPAVNPSGYFLSLPVNTSGKCRRGDQGLSIQIKFPPTPFPEARRGHICCTLKTTIRRSPQESSPTSTTTQSRPSLTPAPPSGCLIRHKLITPLPSAPRIEGRHSELLRHFPNKRRTRSKSDVGTSAPWDQRAGPPALTSSSWCGGCRVPHAAGRSGQH